MMILIEQEQSDRLIQVTIIKNDIWDRGKGDRDPLIQDSCTGIKGYDFQELRK